MLEKDFIGGYIGSIQGLYRDDGKEHGNYYLGFRVQGFCRVEVFGIRA